MSTHTTSSSSSDKLSLEVPPSEMQPSMPPSCNTVTPAPADLDETRKIQFLYHESVINSLDGKDRQYAVAKRRASRSIKVAEQKAKTLTENHKMEVILQKQLEKLNHQRLRHFFFPRKIDFIKNRLSKTLSIITDTIATTKQEASDARRRARSDITVRDILAAQAETLQNSIRTRENILEVVYGGCTYGSPQENSIELERDRLRVVTTHAKKDLATQEDALSLLHQASKQLIKSRNCLQGALMSNSLDLITGRGLGFAAGLSSQVRFRQAADFAKEAGKLIEAAVAINPKLSIASLTQTSNIVVIGLANLFMDGIITDFFVRTNIEKAVRIVDEVQAKLKESIAEHSSIVERFEGNVKGYSVELERTSKDLVHLRTNLMHQVIL